MEKEGFEIDNYFKPRLRAHGLRWFVSGLAIGSVAMYFLDPQRGHRRRVHAVEKANRFKKRTSRFGFYFLQNLKNQRKGLKAKWSHLYKVEQVDDMTLMSRVRSEIGRQVSHAKAIKVAVRQGTIVLSGPILSDEVDRLLKCAEKVRGVSKVINRLDVHHSPGKVSSLQGAGKEYLQ